MVERWGGEMGQTNGRNEINGEHKVHGIQIIIHKFN